MISNRKLGWRAVALGLPALCGLAGAAHADSTVLVPIKFYGFLNGEIESVEAKGGTTPYVDRGRITDGNSRLGATGGIEINATTKAIWQLEASLNSFDQGGINDQGQANTLTSRNSFIGLEDSRFGRVVVGNNDSAYRSLVGSGGALGGNLGLTVSGLDLWNNTTAQLTGNSYSLFSRGESRMKNSIHFTSVEVAGLQAAASYGFDEAREDGLSHSRASAALKYHVGGLQLGLGYDHQANTGADVQNQINGFGFRTTSADGASTSFVKLVASYTFATGTYIGAGVEQGHYGFSQFVPPSGSQIYPLVNTGTMKQTGLMLSLAQPIGQNATVMFSGGRLSRLDNAQFANPDDYGATQFSVGGKYRFNEYLAGYVYATRIKNKSQQSVNFGQNPLYSVGIGTSSAYLSPGDSPQAAGVGLIASF